jgi:hypothetical protein
VRLFHLGKSIGLFSGDDDYRRFLTSHTALTTTPPAAAVTSAPMINNPAIRHN